MTSSLEAPPPLEDCGWSCRSASSMLNVSFCAYVMLALSCRMKTLHGSLMGRLFTYSM